MKTWTKTDFRIFAILMERTRSNNGSERVMARLDVMAMEKRLGKEAVGEMWAKLQRKSLAQKPAVPMSDSPRSAESLRQKSARSPRQCSNRYGTLNP